MKRIASLFSTLAIAAIAAVALTGCGAKEEPAEPGPVAQPGANGNAPDGMNAAGGGADTGAPDLATTP